MCVCTHNYLYIHIEINISHKKYKVMLFSEKRCNCKLLHQRIRSVSELLYNHIEPCACIYDMDIVIKLNG